MGASLSRLVFLLNREFLCLVLIADVIAAPVAYFAMTRWLRGFAYHVSFKPWFFSSAWLLSLAGALLVTGWQTLKAASANPADTLRHE